MSETNATEAESRRARVSVGGRWGLHPNTARIVAAELRRLAAQDATPEDLRARADEIERDWAR